MVLALFQNSNFVRIRPSVSRILHAVLFGYFFMSGVSSFRHHSTTKTKTHTKTTEIERIRPTEPSLMSVYCMRSTAQTAAQLLEIHVNAGFFK